jgi:hypothetical protein
MINRSNIFWLLYFGFVGSALFFSAEGHVFWSGGPFTLGRTVVWGCFLGFTLYSFYCSSKENLFKTIKAMAKFHWGRQIGLDLYIGLLLSSILIYMHGGAAIFLLWLVPILLFGNLATLLYFAIHFDTLVNMSFIKLNTP